MGRTKKQSKEVPQNTNIVEDATDGVSETKLELDLGIKQLGGVGDVTEKKLKGFGVTSLRDICVRGAREISEITGVTKSAADQWVFNAQKILEENNLIRKSDMGVVDLMEYQSNAPTLQTKCSAVDDLMTGGVKPECLYEVYGEFGSGKTQFCFTLTSQALSEGESVVWVDCEDTFRPNRILEIMKERGYVTDKASMEEALNRITYFFAVQNAIFYTLQTALFAMMFDDDEDDEKLLKKKERIINGSIDSVLRGSGLIGGVVATLKNVAIAFARQRDVKYNPDESAVALEALNLSPVLGIKLRKIVHVCVCWSII